MATEPEGTKKVHLQWTNMLQNAHMQF